MTSPDPDDSAESDFLFERAGLHIAGKSAKKPRKPNSNGKPLEAAIAKANPVIEWTQVPMSARFVGRGKVVPVKAPCDFIGTVIGTGQGAWCDAKTCQLKTAFDASTDKVKPHQAAQLVRHGQAGAIAGLLVESTALEKYYWLDWRLLVARRPTYPWRELPEIGKSSEAIDWGVVVGLGNGHQLKVAS